jgi:hypothetical protein
MSEDMAHKSLRQGDALSPMLFILVMEALTLMFKKAEENRVIKPFPRGSEVPQRFLVYADDVILFLRASVEDAVVIKSLLDIFGDVSGLKCNLAREKFCPSDILGRGRDQGNQRDAELQGRQHAHNVSRTSSPFQKSTKIILPSFN